MKRLARVVSLGLIEYEKARTLQESLVEARKLDLIPDLLLLLRHPDVITLGRPDSRRYLRFPESELNVPVVEAGRGGQITFHGPGQLIAYPILKLEEEERDLHKYLRSLEEIALRICRSYDLQAIRIEGRTGAWVNGEKIAAIGVRARSWITFHGIAINRTTDLRGFDNIVPCGISDAGITSLEHQLGREVSSRELQERFCRYFTQVLSRELQTMRKEELEEVLRVAS